jgi:hypothetical protein
MKASTLTSKGINETVQQLLFFPLVDTVQTPPALAGNTSRYSPCKCLRVRALMMMVVEVAPHEQVNWAWVRLVWQVWDREAVVAENQLDCLVWAPEALVAWGAMSS